MGPPSASAQVRPFWAVQRLVEVLGPFLLGGRHDVVVVGADDLSQHVVGQVGHLLRVGHVDGLATAHDERLQLLRAHDGGGSSAGGMVAGIDDAGVGQQVLAGRADGGHAEIGALLARERLGGGAGALAPHLIGGLDLNIVIVDLQINRFVGSALDDDGIPAGLLDGRTDHAAGVGVNNLMIGGIGGKGGDGGAARQGNTGGGQRADGEHDLVLWGERIGAGGHFVVHDLVGYSHAAQILFIRVGGRDGNGFVGQVDAEDLTGPAIGLVGIQF